MGWRALQRMLSVHERVGGDSCIIGEKIIEASYDQLEGCQLIKPFIRQKGWYREGEERRMSASIIFYWSSGEAIPQGLSRKSVRRKK